MKPIYTVGVSCETFQSDAAYRVLLPESFTWFRLCQVCTFGAQLVVATLVAGRLLQESSQLRRGDGMIEIAERARFTHFSRGGQQAGHGRTIQRAG